MIAAIYPALRTCKEIQDIKNINTLFHRKYGDDTEDILNVEMFRLLRTGLRVRLSIARIQMQHTIILLMIGFVVLLSGALYALAAFRRITSSMFCMIWAMFVLVPFLLGSLNSAVLLNTTLEDLTFSTIRGWTDRLEQWRISNAARGHDAPAIDGLVKAFDHLLNVCMTERPVTLFGMTVSRASQSAIIVSMFPALAYFVWHVFLSRFQEPATDAISGIMNGTSHINHVSK